MKLRKLIIEDAPLMLEWMHDPSVVRNMQTDFSRKELKDCIAFIHAAEMDDGNLHLAIADDDNIYQGTVSLKHFRNGTAEFAITIRKSAMGTGVASLAMKEIIRRGFEGCGLKQIYWCVNPENKRAVRFYDKNQYNRICVRECPELMENIQGYTEHQIDSYIWYFVNNG